MREREKESVAKAPSKVKVQRTKPKNKVDSDAAMRDAEDFLQQHRHNIREVEICTCCGYTLQGCINVGGADIVNGDWSDSWRDEWVVKVTFDEDTGDPVIDSENTRSESGDDPGQPYNDTTVDIRKDVGAENGYAVVHVHNLKNPTNQPPGKR